MDVGNQPIFCGNLHLSRKFGWLLGVLEVPTPNDRGQTTGNVRYWEVFECHFCLNDSLSVLELFERYFAKSRSYSDGTVRWPNVSQIVWSVGLNPSHAFMDLHGRFDSGLGNASFSFYLMTVLSEANDVHFAFAVNAFKLSVGIYYRLLWSILQMRFSRYCDTVYSCPRKRAKIHYLPKPFGISQLELMTLVIPAPHFWPRSAYSSFRVVSRNRAAAVFSLRCLCNPLCVCVWLLLPLFPAIWHRPSCWQRQGHHAYI